jgi:hypothetical protein
VLAAVELRQLERRDLGDGVPLVGRLERTGQQARLGDRLGRLAWVDAGRPERDQPLDAGRRDASITFAAIMRLS